MKADCRLFLEDYISKHIYGKSHDYDFYKLFKIFSAYEITCPADTKKAVDEFYDFIDSFKKIIFKDMKDTPKLISYSAKALHLLFERPLTPLQIAFSSLVTELAPKGKDTAILEVGAGMYPKTAISLAQHFKSVTAVDKQFILSINSMDCMNVRALEECFDINAQIKDYDFIIGRRPCSAIESIVKLAKEENKPYFIELCECLLPENPDPSVYKDWGWKYVLPKYDEGIQFTSGYAYNLGSANDKAKKLILEKMPQELFDSLGSNKKSAKPAVIHDTERAL